MPEFRMTGGDKRPRRRWSFAGCVFDEANWSLFVDGKRVPVETKPLELLRELLLRAGDLVAKDELLDRIWPNVTVVEASLTTAAHKLRVALSDDMRDPHIIQTVPRIGYRFAVPVEFEDAVPVTRLEPISSMRPEPIAAASSMKRRWQSAIGRHGLISVAGALAALGVLSAIVFGPFDHLSAAKNSSPLTQRDAANALRRLDVGTIEKMLAAGWDPNTPFDKEGNGAINYVLNKCEWDRGHDQEQMVLMVRTLIDGGARLDHRNVWGDTPYSIAKAVRYCGPDHPVTNSIRTMCYAGYKPLGDRCLASYELARR